MGNSIEFLSSTNSTYTFESDSKFNSVSFTATATANTCTHKTGWYGKVEFWIFSKQIFTCSDCGKILTGKELKEFRKRRRK